MYIHIGFIDIDFGYSQWARPGGLSAEMLRKNQLTNKPTIRTINENREKLVMTIAWNVYCKSIALQIIVFFFVTLKFHNLLFLYRNSHNEIAIDSIITSPFSAGTLYRINYLQFNYKLFQKFRNLHTGYISILPT